MTAFPIPREYFALEPLTLATASTVSTVQLSASTYTAEWIFEAEAAVAITRGSFSITGTTGTPPTYALELCDVDESGSIPRAGSTVHASGTVTPTPASSTAYTVTFSSSYTPTLGQLLALRLKYSSGTINGSNFAQALLSMNNAADSVFPQALSFTTIASAVTGGAAFGYGSASRWYGTRRYSNGSARNTVSTNGHVTAFKFQIPSEFDTMTLHGFRVLNAGANVSASSSWRLTLRDATTELYGKTYDSDTTRGNVNGMKRFILDTPQTLSAATNYYIGFERTASNVSMPSVLMSDADYRSAYTFGTTGCASTWNGSAWTDVTTEIPCVSLIFSEYTLASSGGGSSLILPQTFSPMMSL